MKITIICSHAQALWMAKSEFESSGIHTLDMIKITRKNGCFVIPVEDEGSKAFLEFVQSRKFFKKYFQTQVYLDEITGFTSSEYAVDAINVFNAALNDFYIEPFVEISEVRTNKGILHIPEICNCRLERIFWDFVFKHDTLEENVLTGDEVYP